MKYLKMYIIFVSVFCKHYRTWSPPSNFSAHQSNWNVTNIYHRYIEYNNTKYSNRNGHIDNSVYIPSSYSKTQDFKPTDLVQILSLRRGFIDSNNKITKWNTRLPLNITLKRKKLLRRPQISNSNKSLYGRFLEVFEVVQFEHEPCFSSTGLEGTCLHDYDCQKINGTSMGTCADGYGICCIIIFQCDTYSTSPVGWFTNPGYPGPSTDRLSCTLTLDKISDQVKQLRLDFMTFEILSPTAGSCEQDQFLVTGQNINNVIPILCGINSGQHMYIEISESKSPITLSFQTVTPENRLFSIKVTQLTSANILSAPAGCLQYYNEEHGYMESFNYRDTTEIGITRTPTYLNNLNYAMCIERKTGSCSITYTNVGDMQIVNYDSDGLPVIPPRQAGVEIFDCPSDWLFISAVRLCGERLNDGAVIQDFSLDAPVTDDGAGPIVVWFRSDGIYSGRGFKIYYQQNSCTT